MRAIVYRPNEGRPPVPMPDLIDDTSIEGSTEKVRNNLRDLCALVLAHLRPVLLGDFSWVENHLEHEAKRRRGE